MIYPPINLLGYTVNFNTVLVKSNTGQRFISNLISKTCCRKSFVYIFNMKFCFQKFGLLSYLSTAKLIKKYWSSKIKAIRINYSPKITLNSSKIRNF